MGGYGLVDTGAGEGAIGGGIGPAESSAEAGVKIYVRVDDLDAYLDRAERLRGDQRPHVPVQSAPVRQHAPQLVQPALPNLYVWVGAEPVLEE